MTGIVTLTTGSCSSLQRKGKVHLDDDKVGRKTMVLSHFYVIWIYIIESYKNGMPVNIGNFIPSLEYLYSRRVKGSSS